MDVNEWMSYECLDAGTSVRHILRAFITYLLVHMYQKKKIALEIANGPQSLIGWYNSDQV